jgi:hypothetical protein
MIVYTNKKTRASTRMILETQNLLYVIVISANLTIKGHEGEPNNTTV